MSLNKVTRFVGCCSSRQLKLLQLNCLSSKSVSKSIPCVWSTDFRRNMGNRSDDLPDLDKPIKFTTSGAAKWTADDTFYDREDTPRFQIPIIKFSIASLLIYFCILREENDVDEELGKSLWERIPGLEMQQLRTLYLHNLENSISTVDIVERIQFLEEKEAKEKEQKQTRNVVTS